MIKRRKDLFDKEKTHLPAEIKLITKIETENKLFQYT